MVKQSNRKDNISLFQSLRIAANTEEIASGIAGGVAIVVIIVGLIIYRNWRYEQELDSLLWKIDYKDIQIPDLPAVSSGQGKAPRVSLRAERSLRSIFLMNGKEKTLYPFKYFYTRCHVYPVFGK